MIMEKFNRKNNEIDVLIISTKFENLRQNMQNDCCDCIFSNTWLSTLNAAQCFDQIHQMNQTLICHFYIVNLNHFYDQMMQINAINKMLIILKSMKAMKMTLKKIETMKINQSNLIKILINNMIKARLVSAKANQIYQKQYNFRNFRIEWSNARDLTDKNFLSVEIEFRKRFKLKKLSLKHCLSQQQDDHPKTFKKQFRYDANMLSINNIFFDHSINIFINWRQDEIARKQRAKIKIAKKDVKNTKRKNKARKKRMKKLMKKMKKKQQESFWSQTADEKSKKKFNNIILNND